MGVLYGTMGTQQKTARQARERLLLRASTTLGVAVPDIVPPAADVSQPPTPYYSDDLVTLYLGDCREIGAWLAADVLVTDPPYGIKWTSGVSWYTGGRRLNLTRDAIAGDETTQARDDVLTAWGDRPAAIFGSWRAARPVGVKHRLVWHKAGMNPGPISAAFMSQDEEIYILGDGWRKSSPPLRSVLTTTENRAHQPKEIGHPTPKPVGLMEVLIDRCPPGVIADPFAGSGATLIAAKNLGRRSVGVEVDERYCEVIAKRLCQDTLFGGAA